MYLITNRMNFSIGELYNVNVYGLRTQQDMQLEYDGLLHHHATNGIGCPPIIIASLTSSQLDGIKFLLANGFTQIGEQRTNPNSGNKIILFLKKISPSIPAPNAKILYNQWLASYYAPTNAYYNKTHIAGIYISCGIYNIISPELITSNDDMIAYLNSWRPQCVYVLTSIPVSRTDTIKLFEDHEFFKIADSVSYYNNNEPFALYMRYINAAYRKSLHCNTAMDDQGKTE